MFWEELLQAPVPITAPWVGGPTIQHEGRLLRLEKKPPEHGWYGFTVQGRKASVVEPCEPDYALLSRCKVKRGYLVGDRLVEDNTKTRSFSALPQLRLVEPGLEKFSRVQAAVYEQDVLLYTGMDFDLGPEHEVRVAFEEGGSISSIKGVTPALHSAFALESRYRQLQERRRREAAQRREEEERQRLAEERRQSLHTAEGRRALATEDYQASATAALAVSGATLLSCREVRSEYVITFRYRERRWECVADMALRIVDSGICLTDESTGYRWDAHLTLESLPDVIGEAIDTGQLVVYRHA